MTDILWGIGSFLSLDEAYDLILTIVSTVDFHVKPILQSTSATTLVSTHILRAALRLLIALADKLPSELPENVRRETMPALFVLAIVLPNTVEEEDEKDSTAANVETIRGLTVDEWEASKLAKTLWDAYEGLKDMEEVRRTLKGLITDTETRVSPISILQSLSSLHLPPLSVLPPPSEFHHLLITTTPADPVDPTLAMIEPLIPFSPSTSKTKQALTHINFDSSGYSPYARATRALLHALISDRHIARMNLWALQHVLTLALLASEAMQVPNADNPVFKKGFVSRDELRAITRDVQKVAAFLLSSAGGEKTWHRDLIGSLSAKGKGKEVKLDEVGTFVRKMIEDVKETGSVRDSLVLSTVLQHILPATTKEDADGWVELARELEVTGEEILIARMSFSFTDAYCSAPNLACPRPRHHRIRTRTSPT